MPTKTTSGRVVISRNPKELLDLSAKVYAKHQADGTASELNNLVDFDWNAAGPTIDTALDYHRQAEALKKQMENAYRMRDALVVPINRITRASAKYLKGKYAAMPKKLAAWGYPVDDTPQAKKPKKPKPEE